MENIIGGEWEKKKGPEKVVKRAEFSTAFRKHWGTCWKEGVGLLGRKQAAVQNI